VPSRRCLWRLVGNQFHIVDIGIDEPDLAILEISEELCILDGIEFAGPKNLGGVDIRSVVYPLVVKIVIFFVAHHDQVLAGSVREFFSHGCPAGVALASPFQLVAEMAPDKETSIDCEKINDGPGKRQANVAST
jgi:hypothetical protein